MFEFLTTRRDGPVEYVTLNRPDVRNAFNEQVIDELSRWAVSLSDDNGVRVAVMAGAGATFCAGGDLAWMARVGACTREENLRDAAAAARMYAALDQLRVPLIGRVHGAALGGGAGLLSICDVVVAESQAMFGFTEVKVGILPAVISPYVLAKIGISATRELFLTGMRFDAVRAREIGLVHTVVSAAQLDERVDAYVREILSAGPEAVIAAKMLLRAVTGKPAHEVGTITTEALATSRASDEGREGLKAFLEKRKARWNVSSSSDRQ